MLPATAARVTAEFYDTDCETLAKELIGKVMVHVVNQKRVSGVIVEVEAYLGDDDKASHTYLGKQSQKNKSMYLPAGHVYIYKSFRGQNDCFNITSAKKEGVGAGVLIRALEPVLENFDLMKQHRLGMNPSLKAENISKYNVCAGPARLCHALKLSREEHDGIDMKQSEEIFLEELTISDRACTSQRLDSSEMNIAEITVDSSKKQSTRYKIASCPRINIDYAEEWKDKPLRFCWIERNAYLSCQVPIGFKNNWFHYP
ncbi:hypothetical protein C9374_012641 [Naegleria lovaniensis]|uniref:DNA-3-methyladenine glycosylase II n=1 Tax=Naegleria lovaniensis TaxID=51637 RepID=A0AA88H2D4_NAELO|nr:uncharacterized protein C9374_012641 [Naegleria lovaniensis]KAG2392389.1 hypothetical protein C9374_012641 [Naegleria lovaniensis]